MHKDILSLMKRLGLKEKEARIYLVCLSNKNGLFIYEIAKITRIIRSTVDLTVRRLSQQGFLNKIRVGRRQRYTAQAPEAILFRHKQLVEDLEQVIPVLSQMGGQKQETDVIYFEGREGYQRIYEDVLRNLCFAEGEKRDLLSFTSGVDAMRLFPNMKKTVIDKRIKNGSWFRGIAPQDSKTVREWTSSAKALREIKYLPKDLGDFHIDANIYADNIMLYSPTNPIGGVVIRNAKIAEAMRSLFKLVWNLLPDENGI